MSLGYIFHFLMHICGFMNYFLVKSNVFSVLSGVHVRDVMTVCFSSSLCFLVSFYSMKVKLGLNGC